MNPIGNIAANPAAFTSLQRFDSTILVNGQAYDNDETLIESEFSVNPANPYFYIFGASPSQLGNDTAHLTYAALRTVCQFTSGGSVVSELQFYWGDSGVLDANLSAPQFNMQVGGDGGGFGLVNDPVANKCGFFAPGDQNYGQILRWTSICDKLRMRTSWLFAHTFDNPPATDSSLLHGFLQQQW